MQRISPFLWFDTQAVEAADFYVSVFPNSHIREVMRSAPDAPAMGVSFVLDGVDFQALNGGPEFNFTEAVSFFVAVDDQEQIDRYWQRLATEGGSPGRCGWLKDKYGLSWQIVPTSLRDYIAGPDREGASRAMTAMLGMSKLSIPDLRAAYAGK